MQKKYKAKEKTVNKMGRDGLLAENLHSRKTERISRREIDSPMHGGGSAGKRPAADGRNGKKSKAGKRQAAHGAGIAVPHMGSADTESKESGLSLKHSLPYDVQAQGTGSGADAYGQPDSGKGTAEAVPPYQANLGGWQGSGYADSGVQSFGTPPDTVRELRGRSRRMERVRRRRKNRFIIDSAVETVCMRRRKPVQAQPCRKERTPEQEGMAADAAGDLQKQPEKCTETSAARNSRKLLDGKTDIPSVGGGEKEHQKKNHSRLKFDDEEKNGMVCGSGMGIVKKAACIAAGSVSAVDRLKDMGQEDDSAETENETLRKTRAAGMGFARYAAMRTSRRMRKYREYSGRNTARHLHIETEKKGGSTRQDGKYGAQAGDRKEQAAEMTSAGAAFRRKAQQKHMIKKRYQETWRSRTAGEAQSVSWKNKLLRSKAAGRTPVMLPRRRGLMGAMAFLIVLFAAFSAVLSCCGSIAQGVSSGIIATTYPSSDEDIYAAEAGYAALEEVLDAQVCQMESAHPGYDEYRYQVDEISHDPYQLISFLTAVYGGFTYEQIKDVLPELFSAQYRLTVEETVEMRKRLEGEAGEETEVEYEWHVLCISLTNLGLDAAARGLMTEAQAGHYAAYNAAHGNRGYLFDEGSIPPAGGAGADGQHIPGYEVPPEALSDVRFANMVQEAEKYLGYPYVWGGSSPSTSFDCSGFVSWVVNNCGNGWSVGRQTAEGLRGCCAYVSPAEARPGDLIFFQGTYNTPGASHVGIYIGNGMMIHCGKPVQYANINTAYWQQHFLSYGRLP